MKLQKFYITDGKQDTVEYAADEKEARAKWAKRTGKPTKGAAVTQITAGGAKSRGEVQHIVAV